MKQLLLLYDETERDLARDLKELLDEVKCISITMIPLALNRGLTLTDKEAHYFESANGAIFLLTPGAERLGELYPSPSVTHEMGQAIQKFKNTPAGCIYLLEDGCKPPSIDQRTYIKFDRKNMRSVLSALTQLIKELKSAGFKAAPVVEEPKSGKIDFKTFAESLELRLRQIVVEISKKDNGDITDLNLKNTIATKHHMDTQEINFMIRDLRSSDLIVWGQYSTHWHLTELGWDIAKFQAEKQKQVDNKMLATMMDVLSKRNVTNKE